MTTSAIFDPRPTPYFDEHGDLAAGAMAFFYLAETNTKLEVFTDPSQLIPHPWPVRALANGTFPPIYLPFIDYRVQIKSARGVPLYDASAVSNPAPQSAGGGITVYSTQILQTGDIVARLRVGPMAGFVRCNGGTIGGLTSGASEYAGPSARALYTALWQNLPDSIAPVSSGRGANAAEDFTANKTIVVPSFQGRVLVGVDDMGAAAAGEVQAITTCTTTAGSAAVVVASAARVVKGQSAFIDGIAAGTVIAVSGTTITLSAPVAAAGSNRAWRSSLFSNAQQIGAAAGSAAEALTTDQMPAHTHGVTDPGHAHAVSAGQSSVISGGPLSFGGFGGVTVVPTVIQSATTGLTVNSAGGGAPLSLLQPARLVTYYMKL